MAVTRDMVATRAKVSSATVSRVFNNPLSVSPPLREAVLQAADELGYIPNKAAGMLRRRGTGVIAFVEMAKEGRPYYWGNLESFDWFFGRSLRGVQTAIQESSWQLRFYKVRTKKELEAIERQCDGILAYDVDSPDEVNLFSDLKVPSVLSHHLSRDSAPCVVVTDNYHGGVLQAQFLKKQGCKNPLYITGFIDSVPPHKERLEGFLSLFPNATVLETAVGGPDAIDLILDKVKTKEMAGNIDGLSAVNDLTLFELLLKSRSTLPCIGYDASPFYRLFNGPVASIDIQSGEIYRMAALELLSLIEGAESQQKVVLPKLVELK